MFRSIFFRYQSLLIFVFLMVPLVMWTPGCGKEEGQHDHDAHSQGSSDSATTQRSSESSAKPSDDYPLATCVVSGEPIDAMGGAIVIQHEGREVRFCCKSCVTQFNEDPSKYLAILDQAAKSDHKTETNGIDPQEAGHHGHEGHHH